MAIDRFDQWVQETTAFRSNSDRGTSKRRGPLGPLRFALVVLVPIVVVVVILMAVNRSTLPDTNSPSFHDGYTAGKSWATTYVAIAGGRTASKWDVDTACQGFKSEPAWKNSNPKEFLAGCTQSAIEGLGDLYTAPPG
ncbi:MAG: hypothetical protein QOH56_2805 [Pseudonocardiales bacterium]|jgi:hypothetical protein|nr:hypothetical protein [Pseudonocardiales bacterium]